MKLDQEVSKLNNVLEGICMTANALREPDFQPEFDCYVDLLNFNTQDSFEENFKHFFIEQAKAIPIKKMSNFNQNTDWQFEMKSSTLPIESINSFFGKNLFSTMHTSLIKYITELLIDKIKQIIGNIIIVKHGYIYPIQEYNTYSQHWQHLYIHGEHAEILVTFEANT